MEGATLDRVTDDLAGYMQGYHLGEHAMVDTKVNWSAVIPHIPNARNTKSKDLDPTAIISFLEKDLQRYVKEDKASRLILAKTEKTLHDIFTEAGTNSLEKNKLDMYYTMKMGGNIMTEHEKYAETLEGFLKDEKQDVFKLSGPPVARKVVRLQDAEGEATGTEVNVFSPGRSGGPSAASTKVYERVREDTLTGWGIAFTSKQLNDLRNSVKEKGGMTEAQIRDWFKSH